MSKVPRIITALKSGYAFIRREGSKAVQECIEKYGSTYPHIKIYYPQKHKHYVFLFIHNKFL